MPYRIRTASPKDAESLLAIYAPFVSDTTVSFEVEVPSVEEFERRILNTSRDFAYLVAEDARSGEISGYAYYSTLRSRPAYQWSAETSVYLAPNHRGHGLGTKLVGCLERLMARQGIALSVACITSGNLASVKFHDHLGYRTCGTFDNCAFKLGCWLSVTWMEKQLLPCLDAPDPRRRLTADDLAEVLND